MSDTGINSSDLSSTASIANKISESFYPNGEVVITGTTMSRQPYEDRSLRSADPVKLIQGDGLYRNPAFAINAYAQSTQSAMHGIVASMSDLNDDIKIADPNDPRGTPLTGAAAKMEIAKNSMLVTGYAPGGFSESIKALNNSIVNSTVQPENSDLAYVTSEMGATVAEKTSGYTPSSEPGMVLNGGSRAIALDSLLSDKEKEVYAAKIAELNNKANFKGSANPFQLNLSTNSKGQNLSTLGFTINQEPSYISGSMQSVQVDPNLLGTGLKKCYVSAALIEMLLQVTNKIFIDGGTGTDRTLVGPNFSVLNAENNTVSDHAFGRGFDIMAVGNSTVPSNPLSKNMDTYRQGLHLFLTTLNGLTQDLHPDLIVVHDQLMAELGIAESGLEGANAAVRAKYPNLGKFVNFAVDSSHRDHIHVSYSPQRAGSFITPEIATEITGITFTAQSAQSGISMDKFKQNFFGKPNASLSPDELMALLSTSGLFSLEVSAMFTAIAEREANVQPAAINTKRPQDFSVGMFQINLLPKAHGDKTFYLKYNASGQPEDSTALGYKLAYSIDSDNNPKTLADKVMNQATQATVDRRVWIPYNQAWMLGVTAVGSARVAQLFKNNKQIDHDCFFPWGEYGTTYVPGFIFKTKFSTALSVYLNRGGTDANLRKWIRTNITQKSSPKAYKYIEGWMGGSVYDKNGNVL
jgi:hypothetical protein